MKIQFCPYCGTKLDDGARFCKNCGEPIVQAQRPTCETPAYEESKAEIRPPITEQIERESISSRKTVYDGEVHKCPNCGEVLKAFEISCPACGCELRGVKATGSVKEFALKLEAIEAKREYEKPRGLFTTYAAQLRVSKTDAQKISLIKNFAVPISKEDMLEFMILATSNMNMNAYDFSNSETTKAEKELSAAWFSKAQQVYEKAKRSFSTDDVFAEIKELYDQCNINIKSAKKKGSLKMMLLFGSLIGMMALLFCLPLGMDSKSEKEAEIESKAEMAEIERLEGIVAEVQQALDSKEYRHALRIADSIDYQRYDAHMERQWDIEREYWVEKVIDAAATDGIILDYTPTPDIDKANNESEYDNEEDSDSSADDIESELD